MIRKQEKKFCYLVLVGRVGGVDVSVVAGGKTRIFTAELPSVGQDWSHYSLLTTYT